MFGDTMPIMTVMKPISIFPSFNLPVVFGRSGLFFFFFVVEQPVLFQLSLTLSSGSQWALFITICNYRHNNDVIHKKN